MGHKLLLADDSITIQKVVELVLAGEGFEIKATNNGDEALSALQSYRPDVILADIAMPVMNGYQLCEKVKANPDTKQIPVILLAGAFEPIDHDLAKKVGSNDYIVKPFESQELIGKVQTILANFATVEEAQPVEAETLVSDEDLWKMEEISAEPVAEEAMGEALFEEELVAEESLGTLEEDAELAIVEEEPVATEEVLFAEEEILPSFTEPEPRGGFVPPSITIPEAPFAAPPSAPIAAPAPVFVTPAATAEQVAAVLPSRDEVLALFKAAVDAKVAAAASSIDLDIQGPLLAAVTPAVRESAERAIEKIAPLVVDRVVKEMLQGVLGSLAKEIEKVIWEAVPGLAETMISKEIERIKSEM